MKLTAIDLYCGAGGFSHALESAGFKVLCGIDSWPIAVKTYSSNFRHPVLCRDISNLSADELFKEIGGRPNDVDLLVGGPPCQGFSIQRIGPDDDSRNDQVLAFGRMISEISPRFFIMENVKGFLGRRGAATREKFLEELKRSNYETRYTVVDASSYGIPQRRKRTFFYGWRRGELPEFSFPPPTVQEGKLATVWQAIGDLPEPPEDCRPSPHDPLHRRTRMSEMNRKRLRLVPQGGGMEDLPIEMRAQCHQAGPSQIGHRKVYGRLAPDEPAGTITARFDSFTRGMFAHPYENRNITLREGARLQTFSDSFVFLGTQEQIAAQIGNAVPPVLGQCISVAVYKHLSPKTLPTSQMSEQLERSQLQLFS